MEKRVIWTLLYEKQLKLKLQKLLLNVLAGLW